MSDSIKFIISIEKSSGPVEVDFSKSDKSNGINLFEGEYILARDALYRIKREQEREIARVESDGVLGRVALDSNILAVLASRGAGKSSFLRSLILTENERQKSDKREYYFLKEVDPSLVPVDSSLAITLLSGIYAEIERRQSMGNCLSVSGESQEVFALLQKAIKGVHTLKKDKSQSHEELGLRDLALRGNSLQIRNDIYLLVKKFLRLFGDSAERLVWSIDDFDLAKGQVGDSLEDLRIFFNVPNVIILLTADFEGVKKGKVGEEMNDLKSLQLELEDQKKEAERRANNYLEKLLPRSWRVYLKPFNNKFDANRDFFYFDFVDNYKKKTSVRVSAAELRSIGAWHVYGVYYSSKLLVFDPLEAENLREFVHRILQMGELVLDLSKDSQSDDASEQLLDEKRKEFRQTGRLLHYFDQDYLDDARYAGEFYKDISFRIKSQIVRTAIKKMPLWRSFDSSFKTFSGDLPFFREVWMNHKRDNYFKQLLLIHSVDDLFGSRDIKNDIAGRPIINFLDENPVESILSSPMTVNGRNCFVAKSDGVTQQRFWSLAFASTYYYDDRSPRFVAFESDRYRLQVNKRSSYDLNWVNIIPLFLIGRNGAVDLINSRNAPIFVDTNEPPFFLSDNLKEMLQALHQWVAQVNEEPQIYRFFVETINNPVFFAELITRLKTLNSSIVRGHYELVREDNKEFWNDHAALEVSLRLVKWLVPSLIEMYSTILPASGELKSHSSPWQLGDSPDLRKVESLLMEHPFLESKSLAVKDLGENKLIRAAEEVLLVKGVILRKPNMKVRRLNVKDLRNAIRYFAKSIRELRDGRRKLSTVYDYMKKGVGAGVKLYKQDPTMFSRFDGFLSEKGITNSKELAFLKPEEIQEFVAVFEDILANLREYQSRD